jgi:hypothetical protein
MVQRLTNDELVRVRKESTAYFTALSRFTLKRLRKTMIFEAM